MENNEQPLQLPEAIAPAWLAIPKALVPNSLKVLDRLVSASADIPLAWLEQQAAKIRAQTHSFVQVEQAIGSGVALQSGADLDVLDRAGTALIRNGYRKQINKEAVAKAAIEGLGASDEPTHTEPSPSVDMPPAQLDEDWLNVFERYAEDASTERMQNLWGRVLSGEIRKPGQYSTRTLRFLSEFSQADALTYSNFCESAFGNLAPMTLVKPPSKKDVRDLMYLEDAGLIKGGTGNGFTTTLTVDPSGNAFLLEGNVGIMLKGDPGEKFVIEMIALTTLGQELIGLLPSRDARAAARAVGLSIRIPSMKSGYLCRVEQDGKAYAMEVLWQEAPTMPTVNITPTAAY